MKHLFAQVPSAKIQRSSFDRSSGLKTTFDCNYLVPIFVDEVLPGDTFSLKEAFLARLATPIFPIMDNMKLDVQYFFVPLRLVWSNFQKFCGEQEDPGDSTDYLVPQKVAPTATATATPSGGYATGSLEDYFGLPTHVPGYSHSALFHRAYNLIWNEWYRDENLQDSVTVDKGDGPDVTEYTLLKRGKRYDYFTSCLPWPQKGDPVTISIIGDSGRLPVHGLGLPTAIENTSYTPVINAGDFRAGNYVPTSTTSTYRTADGVATYNPEDERPVTGAVSFVYPRSEFVTKTSGSITDKYYPVEKPFPIYVDLSSTAAVTINDLRTAFQIQRMLERDARGGTRYIEIIRSHFGVQSPDARLQRPEYLGGSSTPIVISPIPQTSATDTVSPQGNLAAYGTASNSKRVFTKSFVEHGVILGLASVRADLNYQQGLARMWSRKTRYDFYWPSLSHLGEQAVLNKEIYCQSPTVLDDNGDQVNEGVFGYQERYAEYRYKNSVITGEFRSNAKGSDGNPATLDSWHLAQNFASLPVLNEEFIQENVPIARALAVDTAPHILFDGWFKLRCARPMPVYSVPGMIDHF